MKDKKIFTLFTIFLLFFSFFFSQENIVYATENSNQIHQHYNISYYLIHYNGEEHKIVLDNEITLRLMGWQDSSKVKGVIDVKNDSGYYSKNVSLEVSDSIKQIQLDDQTFNYRLIKSKTFKYQFINSINLKKQISLAESNKKETNIEEVKLEDTYGTVFHNSASKYKKADLNNGRFENSIDDDDALNNFNRNWKKAEVSQEIEIVSPSNFHTLHAFKGTKYSTTQTKPSIVYSTFVENEGWLKPVKDGELSGTVGEAKRLEAIKIELENVPYSGNVVYKTHVQSFGWLGEVSNGKVSGIENGAKRLEAIQIWLNGDIAKHFDVYYRVYVETFGWLDWAKNGQKAGSEGLAKRLEAIEIILIEKGGEAPGPTSAPYRTRPSVSYSSHVQSYGWLKPVKDGELSGTVGEAKRLEAIKIELENAPYSGGIEYKTHIQSYGWLEKVSNGNISGTEGESKRMEAIQISLTGDIAKYYDVYYRVHAQSFGWLDWAKNGQKAGTEGLGKRLEAIEIVLVEKDGKAPGPTRTPYLTHPSVVYSSHVQSHGWLKPVKDGEMSGTVGQAKRLEAIKIELENTPYPGNIVYRSHVQSYGWQSEVSNGKVSGTVGKAQRMEAIQIWLTGEIAKHYDVYYRVHIQSFGWLGWAKNGMMAGSEGLAKRLEAIEIKLFPKGKGPSVSRNSAFKRLLTVFIDPGHGGKDPGAISGGVKEKDINLSVAKKVQSLLQQRGYIVYMSRNNDEYVDNYERARKANELDVDIYVSIHTNVTSSKSTSTNGIETYYYLYKTQYPPKINQDMHNNPERIAKSEKLARSVQDQLVKNTGARNLGIKRASFIVVRETKMPAILIELGFINNSSERSKLITVSYQDKLAQGIANGIDKYFQQ